MGCTQAQFKNFSRDAPPMVSLVSRTPWKLMMNVSLEEWESSVAHLLSFPTHLDYSSKKIRFQPWCTQGRQFTALLPAPKDSQDLDVRYIYDELLITSRNPLVEARVRLCQNYKQRISTDKSRTASVLHTAQVVGWREDVVVVQLILLYSTCQFLLINLNTLKILGTYTEHFKEQAYLYECLISPDKTRLLLKPNLLYTLKHRVHILDDVIKVVSAVKNKQESVFEVTGEVFHDAALELVLAYDPRYRHTRVAIANLTRRGQHVLCLYNLRNKKITRKTYGPQYQRTQNLVFSPDGEYLAALLVTYILGSDVYPQKYNFHGTMVYSTRDFSLLRRIQSLGSPCLTSLTPAALFPLFSSTGESLAVGGGPGAAVQQVDVHALPPVLILKSMCRLVLRRYLTPEKITNLPISQQLINYIHFNPTED